jgi:hypothetical protein
MVYGNNKASQPMDLSEQVRRSLIKALGGLDPQNSRPEDLDRALTNNSRLAGNNGASTRLYPVQQAMLAGISSTPFGPKIIYFIQQFQELNQRAVTALTALKNELDSTRVINPVDVEDLLKKSNKVSRQLSVVGQLLNRAGEDDKGAIKNELNSLNNLTINLANAVAPVANKFNSEAAATAIETLRIQFQDLNANIWTNLSQADEEGLLTELPGMFRAVWEEIARVKDENDDLTPEQRKLLNRVDYFVQITGPQCLEVEGKEGITTIKFEMRPGNRYNADALDKLWKLRDKRFTKVIENWDAILIRLLNPDTIQAVNTPKPVTADAKFDPLIVMVLDSDGNPGEGIPVIFTAPESGPSGTFGADGSVRVITDVNGNAQSPQLKANNAIGNFEVKASLSGNISPAVFNLAITSTRPTNIRAIQGSSQKANINTRFIANLEALVTDANGNPKEGVNVVFSAPPDTGRRATGAFDRGGEAVRVVTDVNGIASAPNLMANSQQGDYRVSATVIGVSGLTCNFNLTNDNAGGYGSSNSASSVTSASSPTKGGTI